jgi:hypothetical protein
MGNLCSKSSNPPEQFSTPGRVLGSSSQSQPTSAPVPQKVVSTTPGRTVGGSTAASGGDDPRSAAARAAEVGPIEHYLLLVVSASNTNFDLNGENCANQSTGASSQSVTVDREAVESASGAETADAEPSVELRVRTGTPDTCRRC